MKRVIKVVAGGHIAIIEVADSELDDLLITNNIGLSDGKSYLERTSFFGIEGIDVVCDEEGKLKQLLPSLQLFDDVIAGDCIIVSREIINDEGEKGWVGLDEKQFVLVIEKLLF